MTRLISFLLLIAIVATGLVLFPENKAFACSCAMGSATEKLERSEAVFVGKVIGKGGTKRFEHGRLRKYTFEVDRAWKGVSNKRITIYSYDGGSDSCGYEFKRNRSYLVYSYQGNEEVLQTNLCSGNIPISQAQAQDEIQQLGATTISIKNDVFGSMKDRSFAVNFAVLGGVFVLLLSIALFAWRIRNNRR